MKVILAFFWGLMIMSCNHKQLSEPAPVSPPEAVVIAEPTSVSEKAGNGEYYLFLLLKEDNTVWYKYDDSVESENGLKQIKPNTTAAIVKVLENVETTFHIDLSKMEEHILIKADANL